MKRYNQEIADTVLEHLEDLDWKYTWDEENGIVRYVMNLDGCRFRTADGILTMNPDSFTGFLICPMSADPTDRDGMLAMAEFLSRANYNLVHGCFEMDFRDGEIRYRLTIDCDGVEPSREMVVDALNIPCEMMERYGDGLVEVLYGVRTAEEAVKRCESTNPALDAMLRQLHSSPEEFLDGFRTFLAQQMEDSEGEEEDEDDAERDDSGFLAS